MRRLTGVQLVCSFVGALQVESNVMFLILMLIVIVAAFNIISSLVMLVKDKSKDIAVLRTFGVSRKSMMKIFNDFLTSMSGWVYDVEGCFGNGFKDADDIVSWYFAGNGIFGDFFISFENNAIRKDDDKYKLGTQKAPLTKVAWNELLCGG